MPKGPHRKGGLVSTKVYNAFKVKDPAQLWKVLDKIFRKGRANVGKTLRAHYLHQVHHMVLDKDYAAAWDQSDSPEANFRLHRVHDKIRARYKENTIKLEWDKYSLDCTVCVYPYRGQFYLRAFCEAGSIFRNVLDFVSKLPELEDFHYQNQSDRPEDIRAKDWANRRRVWDGISKKNHDIGVHLDLEICSWGSFYLIDPWVLMAREWMAHPPVLMSCEEAWADNWKRNAQTLHNIEAGDGFIRANGGKVSVVRNKDGTWQSSIEGQVKRHKDLNRAADYIEFEHQSESIKSMVRSMMAQAKEARSAKRKRAAK